MATKYKHKFTAKFSGSRLFTFIVTNATDIMQITPETMAITFSAVNIVIS